MVVFGGGYKQYSNEQEHHPNCDKVRERNQYQWRLLFENNMDV